MSEEARVETDGGEDGEAECEDEARTTGFEATRTDGILRVRRPGTEWLSTGWNGGRSSGPAAYNVSVPEGWACDDRSIDAYVADRLESAGFEASGPVLLTGVDLEHARGAVCGPVTIYATAGISNPAALPMEPSGGTLPDGRLEGGTDDDSDQEGKHGTVNLVVGTTRALEAGALANLVAVAAEAKAATLLAETGFAGTTTDAIVVGHDPDGPPSEFSGSATAVGAATRACVREAVRASLRSRYESRETDASIPESVADAKYGVSTDVRAEVVRPRERERERKRKRDHGHDQRED
ncbi:adenosylcobinamide amidohydrolase [Natronoglomus mannanivorans]|uniref:Adenosylcobinamide amidohydrolase n=1 Tax=Natronoglomus mannanivorans TaxID=2979990 RepID=A0AAP2Z0Y6_9EURY|nr:adenosylcobinamide amidohydrolase [Halobacteria archaeon AArc-xg1-1]